MKVDLSQLFSMGSGNGSAGSGVSGGSDFVDIFKLIQINPDILQQLSNMSLAEKEQLLAVTGKGLPELEAAIAMLAEGAQLDLDALEVEGLGEEVGGSLDESLESQSEQGLIGRMGLEDAESLSLDDDLDSEKAKQLEEQAALIADELALSEQVSGMEKEYGLLAVDPKQPSLAMNPDLDEVELKTDSDSSRHRLAALQLQLGKADGTAQNGAFDGQTSSERDPKANERLLALNPDGELEPLDELGKRRFDDGLRLQRQLQQSDLVSMTIRGGQHEESARAAARADSQAASASIPTHGLMTSTPASLTSPSSAAPTNAATPNFVGVPFGHANWTAAINERVIWMANNEMKSAELRLDPPDLGPLRVKVSVNAEQQTTVVFSSQHAVVRETLEQQLPRLRELMEEQGLADVDVDVRDQKDEPSEQGESSGAHDIEDYQEADRSPDDATSTTVQTVSANGLVDYYA